MEKSDFRMQRHFPPLLAEPSLRIARKAGVAGVVGVVHRPGRTGLLAALLQPIQGTEE